MDVKTLQKQKNDLIKNAKNAIDDDEQYNSLMAEIDVLDAKLEKYSKVESLEAKSSKFDAYMNESAGRLTQPSQPEPVHEDIQRYSLLRAITRYTETKGKLDGLEAEVSHELAIKAGKTPDGFFMPLCKGVQHYSTLNTTSGSGLVNTVTDYTNFIEILRKQLILDQLGVTYLHDLVGVFGMPKQTASTAGYWVNLDGTDELTEDNAEADDQVVMTPSQLGADLSYTRQILNQTSMDVEALLLGDLGAALACSIESAVFNGSGTGSEPEGILQNDDVPTVENGTDGAYMTFAKFVEMETVLAEANADKGNLAYVMSSALRGFCKTHPVNNNVLGRMIWENNEVNGQKAFKSNNMPANLTKGAYGNNSSCIYGNWADVILGFWNNAVDVIIDPYTDRKKGKIHITQIMDLDIALRHPESFVKVVDAKTV